MEIGLGVWYLAWRVWARAEVSGRKAIDVYGARNRV